MPDRWKADPVFDVEDVVREACRVLRSQSCLLEMAGACSEADNLSFYADEMMKNYNIKEW